MAIGSGGSGGTGTATGSGSLNVSATLTAGRVAVMILACDNAGTTDGQTTQVSNVADSFSHTWVRVAEFTNGQGSAKAGACVSVWMTKITTGGANTISLTTGVSGSHAGTVWEFTITGDDLQLATGSLQTLATDGADPGSMSISGLTSKEYLFIYADAGETNSTSNMTGTNYTAFTNAGTASGGSAANQNARGLFRILTATGDTLDPTFVAADHAGVYFALEEVFSGPPPGTPQITATAVQRAAYH